MTNTIIRKLVIKPKEHIMSIKVTSIIGGHEFLEFQQTVQFGKLSMKRECIWVHPLNNNAVSMFIFTYNYDKIIVV